MKKLIKLFALIPCLIVCSVFPLCADDGDQFEYDLFDRMRSGKVFNDANYPPPESDECPSCRQQRRYQQQEQQHYYPQRYR